MTNELSYNNYRTSEKDDVAGKMNNISHSTNWKNFKVNLMTYFDPSVEVAISVTASPTELGRIIQQMHQSIAYLSRALTDAESRNSQPEKEALVIEEPANILCFICMAVNVNMITQQTVENDIQKVKTTLILGHWSLCLQS